MIRRDKPTRYHRRLDDYLKINRASFTDALEGRSGRGIRVEKGCHKKAVNAFWENQQRAAEGHKRREECCKSDKQREEKGAEENSRRGACK